MKVALILLLTLLCAQPLVAKRDSLFLIDSDLKEFSDAAQHQDGEKKHYSHLEPIIVIPGLSASTLMAKLHKKTGPHWYCDRHDDWFHIWISVRELLPGVIDCWRDNMVLHFDEGNNTYTNTHGVEMKPRDFGGLRGISHLDPTFPVMTQYLHDMLHHFMDAGYVPGVNLFGAPYDWRRASPDHSRHNGQYADLKQLVERAFKTSGGRRVHLVGHSLGGPYGQAFLAEYVDQAWKDRHVASFISLAGAFGGSIDAVIMQATGQLWRIPVPKEALRDMTRTYPSLSWMWPAPSASGSQPLIHVRGLNFTAAEIPAVMDRAGGHTTAAMGRKLMPFLGSLTPPNVTSHMFYSLSIPTPVEIDYADGDLTKDPQTVRNEPGDGVVAREALLLFEKWGAQAFPVVHHHSPYGHAEIVFKRETWDAILKITAREA
eukprot:gnl/Trimastix_PCT/1634.p1 GENE.gnl/Trimastix_PCT/1634~~gnl/Trimastix_PCT/1634.p1  ORF type:complete len:430 (+),score=140.32 gnl/Trimastix_PCT/1634:62-1351(+)